MKPNEDQIETKRKPNQMSDLLENKKRIRKEGEKKGKEERITFREKYKYLCEMYHEKYDEELCKKYYERLKHHSAKKLIRAMDIAIDTIRFFPTVAEINEIIANMPPKWLYEKIDKKKPTIQEQEQIDNIIAELTKN